MTTRGIAALVWGACLVFGVGTLVLLAFSADEHTPVDGTTLGGWSAATFAAAALAFGTVGAIVVARVPHNPIGWIFCVTGIVVGAGDLASQYADRAVFLASDPLPGGTIAASIQNVTVPPSFALLGLTLLLFPDGRLPSRRWRPVLWLALGGIGLAVGGNALRPGRFTDPFTAVRNPIGIPGALGLTDALAGLGFLSVVLATALAALGLPARLRRSRGVERQQLRWLALAAAITGFVLVADLGVYFAFGIDVAVLPGLPFAAFPVVAGMAILRYRLFDIDVILNRTLVYGLLTVALGAGYLATVVLLQFALDPLVGGSQLAVAGSTLAVAALFRPARARIQRAVDRRFFRRRYDAARTLDGFSARMRRGIELDALAGELQAVVDETMQPAHVSLWLRGPQQ